jgi:hypothetical protein
MSLPDLTNEFIADSYKGVLHTANQPVTGTELKQVYDGLGNETGLKISSTTIGIGNSTIPSEGNLGEALVFDDTGRIQAVSLFPIGAVYFTTTPDNPQTFLGGVWSRIAQGRFIAGVGTGTDGTYSRTLSSGNTGGNYENSSVIPDHKHGVGKFQSNDDHLFILGDWSDGNLYTMGRTTGEDPYIQLTNQTGSPRGTITSLPIENSTIDFDNTPPAFGLYVWSRTA